MISAYNRSQIPRAAGLVLLSILCYVITRLFFEFGLVTIFGGFRLPVVWIPWVPIALMSVITWSGYRQWRNGDGFKSHIESSLFHELGEDIK